MDANRVYVAVYWDPKERGYDDPVPTCTGCGKKIEPPATRHNVKTCLRVLREMIIHLSASKADADIR